MQRQLDNRFKEINALKGMLFKVHAENLAFNDLDDLKAQLVAIALDLDYSPPIEELKEVANLHHKWGTKTALFAFIYEVQTEINPNGIRIPSGQPC